MRAVVQRVTRADVTISGEEKAQIGKGLLILLGVMDGDNKNDVDYIVKKSVGLRVFEDENGKTNLSLKDVGGSLLLISQFTLYANCRKGNRPSFVEAGNPVLAEELYAYMIAKCREEVSDVQTGSFGAHMVVSLVNDGPFTIVLDEKLFE